MIWPGVVASLLRGLGSLLIRWLPSVLAWAKGVRDERMRNFGWTAATRLRNREAQMARMVTVPRTLRALGERLRKHGW